MKPIDFLIPLILAMPLLALPVGDRDGGRPAKAPTVVAMNVAPDRASSASLASRGASAAGGYSSGSTRNFPARVASRPGAKRLSPH